jgi:peptidoglycan hydrolase-like protein with peptidoglycan-binding domain
MHQEKWIFGRQIKSMAYVFILLPLLLFQIVCQHVVEVNPTSRKANKVITKTDDNNITRNEIIERAKNWIDNPRTYSINNDDISGYRCDGFGYVSMAWRLEKPGFTVSKLDDYAISIPVNELQMGDIIVESDFSSTDIESYVAIFDKWVNEDEKLCSVYEQTSPETHDHTINLNEKIYTCYKLKHLGEKGISVVNNNIQRVASSTPTLRRGSKGNSVKDLQNKLNIAMRANLQVDGDFGPATERAVKDFQRSGNLDVDGIVGPQTWRALNRIIGFIQDVPGKGNVTRTVTSTSTTLRRGSSGVLVSVLQESLNATIKAGLKVDGDFGPKTESAVKKFQKKYKLTVDGIVGQQTWKKINDLLGKSYGYEHNWVFEKVLKVIMNSKDLEHEVLFFRFEEDAVHASAILNWYDNYLEKVERSKNPFTEKLILSIFGALSFAPKLPTAVSVPLTILGYTNNLGNEGWHVKYIRSGRYEVSFISR